MWRNPMPWKNTAGHAEHRHVGADRRHAHRHGARGADAPARVHRSRAACSSRSNSSADFAITQQLHLRRVARSAPAPRRASSARCCGRRSRTRRARSSTACPTTWRCTATRRRSSACSATAGGGGARRRWRRSAAARPAGGATAAADRRQPSDRPRHARRSRRGAGPSGRRGDEPAAAPTPPQVQPWQYALPTEEALKRQPGNLIPPKFRPRVALRFDAQNTLLVSGLLDGGADIAQRPVVVDVPVGQGPRRRCSPTTRSTAARRSAATSWCSTRS